MSVSFIHKLTTKAIFLTTTSLAIVAGGFATFISKAVTTSSPQPKLQQIPVQTSGKAPRLSEARTFATTAAEQAAGNSLSLASADFDEDGTPDVIGGYANGGVGFVSFFRGNVEALYPTPKTTAGTLPFLAASASLNLPVAPDFLATGDFNADGHFDVIAAARGGNTVALLAGDGKGGFAEAQTLTVEGTVTALEAGEINRVDGLADFAVGLTTREGARLLLYTAATGAWQAQPQRFELAQAATSLAFATLRGEGFSDLAVAAGRELVILAGGNQAATMTRQALKFSATALTVGRFTDTSREQIALLASDGAIAIATPPTADNTRARQASRRGAEAWQVEARLVATASAAKREGAMASQLLRTRVAGNNTDDLLLFRSNQLQFVTGQNTAELATASLSQPADLVAVLSLRMNASAAPGLVLLSREQRAPLVVSAVPEATFGVNSVADLPDALPGDGICNSSRAGAPVCTLRAALEEANALAGADVITFNIGAGTQTILVNTPLPTISTTMTLDGTPQGGAPATQSIVLSPGPNFPGSTGALFVTSSNSTIRGLTITGFANTPGLWIQAGNSNVVEGNTIRNNQQGIILNQTSNNQIGGTTAAARNVIGGNTFDGISLQLNTSSGNNIQGNYIGTNAAGTGAEANRYGIYLLFAPNNTIGGTAAGARNVISGNRAAGINLDGGFGADAAGGNLIQGNYIGVDATGTGALGNGVAAGENPGDSGIAIRDANNTIIGGIAPTAGNVIANNGASGINVPTPTGTPGLTATNNGAYGNSIYNNAGLGINLGAAGVTANDVDDPDMGANLLQNFPVLTSALTRPTGTTITGTIQTIANASFTIELFSNAACDASGNGEGETFVGRLNVITSPTGNATFSLVTTTPIPAGRFLTATATDTGSDTSEFSACLLVQNAVTDLSATVAVNPATVTVGNNVTYDITVLNGGPDNATGVTLTDAISIPGGQFTFVSATPSVGTCTSTGPITCNLGALAPNGTATVRVIITPNIPTTPPVSGAPPVSVTATNTATVTGLEVDPTPANNTGSAGATVNALTDLAVTQTVSSASPVSNATLTYTITITNNGPSSAANVVARIDPPVQLLNATCTGAGWTCNRDGNPFFASRASLPPGSATITISGRLACLPQNLAITNAVTVSNQATDSNPANNTSSLTNTAQAGTAIATIAYEAGGTALALGPVVAGSTATPPSGIITVTNTGCLPLTLTNAFFARVTNAAALRGVDDSRYFSLRLIPATGAEIPLPATPVADRNAPQPINLNRTLFSGDPPLRFRIIFSPPLPAFAGTFAAANLGIFATQYLPELFDSQLRFNYVATQFPSLDAVGDTGTAAANITARVSPALQIVARDGNVIGNPATTPLVEMTTIRDDFRVRVSLYDANKNATKITYQFYDTFRQTAGSPIEVNLTPVLSALPALLPGQPFTLQQEFSGASARPDIVYVRVVVNDGDSTTVSASSSSFIPSFTATARQVAAEAIFSDVIQLMPVSLASRIELKAQREK